MAAPCRRSYWLAVLLGIASCTSRSTPPQIVPPTTNKVENNKRSFAEKPSSPRDDGERTRAVDKGDRDDGEASPAAPRSQPRPAHKAPVKQAAPGKSAPPAGSSVTPPGASPVQAPAAIGGQLLDSIYFAQNGATLQQAAVQLKAVASFAMRSDSKGFLLITGHADPAESSPHELSVRRAAVVKDFLINLGVADHRIRVQAFGASQPSTGAMEQPARNQRVEIRCIGP